jgi:hypothetical protein
VPKCMHIHIHHDTSPFPRFFYPIKGVYKMTMLGWVYRAVWYAFLPTCEWRIAVSSCSRVVGCRACCRSFSVVSMVMKTGRNASFARGCSKGYERSSCLHSVQAPPVSQSRRSRRDPSLESSSRDPERSCLLRRSHIRYPTS